MSLFDNEMNEGGTGWWRRTAARTVAHGLRAVESRELAVGRRRPDDYKERNKRRKASRAQRVRLRQVPLRGLDSRAAAVRSQNKQSVRYFQYGIFTAHPYRMST